MTDIKSLEALLQVEPEEVAIAFDQALELATVCVEFAGVERAPRLPNGRCENDAEHSYNLSMVAQFLAAEYYPHLDLGLVAQLSGVHDLPEVYTGDVRTFDISEEDYAKKEAAEDAAVDQLEFRLPGPIFMLLKTYRQQALPEARFVRSVDKLMPGFVNIIGVNASTFKEDYNSPDVQTFLNKVAVRTEELAGLLSEFPLLLALRYYLDQHVAEVLYP